MTAQPDADPTPEPGRGPASRVPAGAAKAVVLLAAVALVVLVIVPALFPPGAAEGRPAWRSIDGVPVVDELPGPFVGILRIARERNGEQARTTVVLDRSISCERVVLAQAKVAAYAVPATRGAEERCPGLRVVTARALPGPLEVRVGGETWNLDPSKRDPRSCQLSRDRTCVYWLYRGGRFGDPLDSEDRVGSTDPQAGLAVGAFPLLNESSTTEQADRASGLLVSDDLSRVMLCVAGAGSSCSGDVSFSVEGGYSTAAAAAAGAGGGATTP